MTRRRRPRRRPVRRRSSSRFQELSGEQHEPRRRALARSTREAPSRWHGSDARRRSHSGIRPVSRSGTSREEVLAARQPEPRPPPDAPESMPRSPVIGTAAPVQQTSSGTTSERRASGCRAPRQPIEAYTKRAPGANPGVIRVRARDECGGRDRFASEARLAGAHHRGRAQPAADDEAPACETGAPDRFVLKF